MPVAVAQPRIDDQDPGERPGQLRAVYLLELDQLFANTFERGGGAPVVATLFCSGTRPALTRKAEQLGSGVVLLVAVVEAQRDDTPLVRPRRGPRRCDRDAGAAGEFESE
jgi:hypothetical protein